MTNQTLRVPVWCPVCTSLMKGKSTNSFYNHGCCVHCFIQFVENREDRWKGGWRPNQEEIDKLLSSLSNNE